MHIKRRRYLISLILLVAGVGLAVGLALFALSQNINLYYTPSQVARGEVPRQSTFRMGGLVVPGSIQRGLEDLSVQFMLTDTAHTVMVRYQGILPDLFREGQGIVAQGWLNEAGEFIAHEVLAKHNEEYMSPAVKHALQAAQQP